MAAVSLERQHQTRWAGYVTFRHTESKYEGLSGKYLTILNIWRTGHVALM
jgi:hypothetical protein